MARKAERALIRTSAPTNSTESGLSLIEMLVVMALIGLMAAFALPSISGFFKLSLNSTTRGIASVVRDAYNATVMTGAVHRVVYDLKKKEYWVESGPRDALLDTAETKDKEERRKRFSRSKKEDGVGETKPGFSLAKSITRKKVALPRGVEFEDVLTQQSAEPITDGLAYTHFFPHGVTERTVVHLKDGSDHHISLIISSLIGRTRVVDRYLSLDEAKEEVP